MGYHPETLVWAGLGFQVWHIDPERPAEGQRTDDSCGWFDRRPGEYASSVKDFVSDTAAMHDLQLTLNRRKHTPMAVYEGISKPRTDMDRAPGYPRLSQADTVAAILMVALELERARWWRARREAPWWMRVFVRRREVVNDALDLALNPIDNLSSVEEAPSMVRLIAAALNRRFKPWWRHPRWHVHHWRVSFHMARRWNRTVLSATPSDKEGGE